MSASRADRIPVFLYGTLQFRAMMQVVLGDALPLRPAELHGFRRHAFRRRVFPAAIPAAHGTIRGYLTPPLDERVRERIDDYEGPPFRRQRVVVADPQAGAAVDGVVYVLRPRYRGLLREQDWDPDRFRRVELDAYARAFRAIYPTGPL